MNRSTPGFPVLHYLLESAQTHVHSVSDAIQPCHPLHPLLPSPSIFPRLYIYMRESLGCTFESNTALQITIQLKKKVKVKSFSRVRLFVTRGL